MKGGIDNRDSFGMHAADYKRYRPNYPPALYEFLAETCTQRDAALDCATGNGQAAVALAEYFDKVLAVDSSPAQIEHAIQRANVEYRVAAAESLPRTGIQFDLVTVAQGAHWLNLPAFYEQVRACARDTTIIAIWGYAHCLIDPAIDRYVRRELLAPIESFWAQGNRVLVDKYRTIEFPFEELPAPDFEIVEHWDRRTLFGYIGTWSAYKRCVAESGLDPLPRLAEALDVSGLWPDDVVMPVRFEVPLRIGRFR